MKTRRHGLTEKEKELVQLLVAECETTVILSILVDTFFSRTIRAKQQPPESRSISDA